LFLLTIRCFAQNGHAAALLQEVAGAVRSTAGWWIEGSVEDVIDDKKSAPADFKLLIDSTGRVRLEQTGKFPALIVCDADKVSVYSPPLRRYQETQRAGTNRAQAGSLGEVRIPLFDAHVYLSAGGAERGSPGRRIRF